MAEKIKILYVDDEINNLISFNASFRLDFNILTAENTTKAEALLAEHPDIRIVFSDQRMPDKTGVEFLSEIRYRYPNPIRILLTAYADLSTVIGAINKGNIFRFVSKPWIEAEILSAIEEANKFYLANSMLIVKNEELQLAYDELDKFAYSVSHDLREPLSSILSAVRLAREFDSLTDIHDLLKLMEKSVIKLNAFILSLHDYYATQRGELTIRDISLEVLANYFYDMYNVNANTAGVNFRLSFHQDGPFRGDDVSLKLIINNLLSNAFRYQRTDIEDKWVSLNLTANQNKAVITISDNGIGISAHHLQGIYKPFYKASFENGGAGLGLFNVKSALAKLSGEISVNSVEGEGTSFTITIPGK
ncbi:Response regulator receiver domain-containing protein [bacterium A37T11]|nr:Response regulator receiver domain-containing protein [bacterium A37T11]